jgi:hypothetical protein
MFEDDWAYEDYEQGIQDALYEQEQADLDACSAEAEYHANFPVPESWGSKPESKMSLRHRGR